MELGEGAVVRDRKWGGRFTGTVVRREGDAVFVAWHNSFVEDQLDIAEVEPVEDATDDMRAWRGGIGVMDAGGDVAVVSVGRS